VGSVELAERKVGPAHPRGTTSAGPQRGLARGQSTHASCWASAARGWPVPSASTPTRSAARPWTCSGPPSIRGSTCSSAHRPPLGQQRRARRARAGHRQPGGERAGRSYPTAAGSRWRRPTWPSTRPTPAPTPRPVPASTRSSR
jgi:hypothetical protein